MTCNLFAAPFAGFTILSPKRPYVPTMVQVRKPSVWHASSLNKTLTAALYDGIKEALELLMFDDDDNERA